MSKIEVNQISSQCGSTLTIGQSGDTVTLASGATQTGFGRTGTVNWDTTAKTAGFTAVSGNGYFVNTTSGAITVTLPATPSAGDIVALQDYAGTWADNNVTIARNGSNIGGAALDAILSSSNQSITLVYVDGTRGWQTVNDSTQNIDGATYIAATGGTVTTCGNYKIHIFTGPGTFTVCSVGNPIGSDTVDYLVVGGGGGGGGRWHSGGGGAGGYRESKATGAPWTASPLATSTSLPVSATAYPITVGAGGSGGASGGNNNGTDGNTSIFSTITAALGGRSGTYNSTGNPGGSGGGAGGNGGAGGTGNTPPVSPPQGNNGGTGETPSGGGGGGGGGGAGAVGSNFASTNVGGDGGAGVSTSISGSSVGYAGGSAGSGPSGGGTVPSPAWGSKSANPAGAGENARANSGSGGGTTAQNCSPNAGGNGGSGVVIIRYKYQ
jgi:hypothetical protein